MEVDPHIDQVYHYCSSSAFFNIIQSKKFHLTSLRRMNDPNEASYLFKVASNIMENEWKKYRSGDPGEDYRLRHEALLRIIELFQKFQTHGCQAACFSQNEDHLMQWRFYADEGRGFNIGIHTDFLRNLGTSRGPLEVFPVQYLKNGSFRNDPEEIQSHWDTCISYVNDFLDGKMEFEHEFRIFGELYHLIGNLIPYYKSEDFIEEAEVRLIQRSYSHIDGYAKEGLLNSKFENTRNCVHKVPYFELLPWSVEPCVRSVYIGPQNESEREEISEFMESEGFENVAVYSSETAFRSKSG